MRKMNKYSLLVKYKYRECILFIKRKMSNQYTPLEEPIGACKDPNIIYIDDLQTEIAKKRKEKDDEIVNNWRATFTRDYIKEKIIEAKANHSKKAVLFTDYRHPNPKYLKDLYYSSGVKDELLAMLDPSTNLYSCGNSDFEIYIRWDVKDDSLCCNII